MTEQAYRRHEQGFDRAFLRQRLLEMLGKEREIYPECLENNFPHVLAKIVMLWGQPEMDTYFQNLMVADRPGRKGFPADAAQELLRLSLAHSYRFSFGIDEKYAVSTAGDREFKAYLDRRQEGVKRQTPETPAVGVQERVDAARAGELTATTHAEEVRRQFPGAGERDAIRRALIASLKQWLIAQDLLKKMPPNELRDAFAVALRQAAEVQEPADGLPPIIIS